MTYAIILKWVSILSILLPLGACVARYHKYLDDRYVPLTIYLYLTTLIEMIGGVVFAWWMMTGEYWNTTALYNFQTIEEFCLLSWLYYNFFRLAYFKQLVKLSNVVFLPMAFWFYWQNPFEWNSLTMTIESLLLIAFVMIYFYELILQDSHIGFTTVPMFWISAGIMLYFAGGFFVFVSSDYIVKSSNSWLWQINHIVNIPYHILMAVGIWITKKKSTE